MPRLVPLLALSALLASSAGAAPDGDGVRLVLSGPATPYARVEYEVAAKRGAVVAGVDKVFAADFGRRGEVGLLPRGDLSALLDELEALGGFALSDHTSPRPRTVWRIEARRGAKRHTITVHDPERLADGRYRALIERVRGLVEATVGPVPYRDALLLPGEFGRLRVRSTPRGTLTVDGVPIAGETPVDDLRLPVGRHRVELTPLAGGEPHPYDVQIEAGRTTSLVVELR